MMKKITNDMSRTVGINNKIRLPIYFNMHFSNLSHEYFSIYSITYHFQKKRQQEVRSANFPLPYLVFYTILSRLGNTLSLLYSFMITQQNNSIQYVQYRFHGTHHRTRSLPESSLSYYLLSSK